ncbi:esterase-like activity of phytase family protein [Labrys portucalensis]|uniref:Esterase-like activity of phytase family protein n=1 Tax=Labrys neptuniae TaxID=376174 RepID=A0ABV6Z7Y3_9HYPH
MRLLRTILLTTLPVLPTLAMAEPLAIKEPFVSSAPGEEKIDFAGGSFVNHGLVGVGRLSADLKDEKGDTLGSFSSMAIDPKSWSKTATGYKGQLRSLPDRGYNNPDKGLFFDYQGRVLAFDFAFTPYSGPALPTAVTSQSQIELKPLDGKGVFLTGLDGKPTTGADPADNTVKMNGYTLPVPPAGALGAGSLSFDAESIAYRSDGSFYVGDEYAAAVYLFGPDGKLKGLIPPGPALVPTKKGKINFTSMEAPDTGRRNNQGLEAISLTPDGKTLYAVLQSGALQDSSAGKNQANRATTRIYVYDVASDPLPKTPKAVYAIELPVYSKKGDGKIDSTAAQSEMVALDDHRFLLLARDGAGHGCDCKNPEMFKAILVVDTSGATNLAGTDYETGTKPIAPAKDDRNVLDPAITPARSQVLVNLLNATQLGKFGLNIDNAKSNDLTLSEKWEAMTLVPALDPAAPNDAFLFVGNDNDFLTRKGVMKGQSYDAGLTNDTLVLAYRLTLPEDLAKALAGK